MSKHVAELAREQNEQERRLAAADEMLNALRDALSWWHSIPAHFHAKEPAWVQMTRDAIAKAEARDD